MIWEMIKFRAILLSLCFFLCGLGLLMFFEQITLRIHDREFTYLDIEQNSHLDTPSHQDISGIVTSPAEIEFAARVWPDLFGAPVEPPAPNTEASFEDQRSLAAPSLTEVVIRVSGIISNNNLFHALLEVNGETHRVALGDSILNDITVSDIGWSYVIISSSTTDVRIPLSLRTADEREGSRSISQTNDDFFAEASGYLIFNDLGNSQNSHEMSEAFDMEFPTE